MVRFIFCCVVMVALPAVDGEARAAVGDVPLAARPVLPVLGQGSITDTSVSLPSWEEFSRVLTLRDYNTRVVVLGTTALGLAAGLVGTFMLLRKRALLGDALSHATLPGIGLAFIVMASAGHSGKSLPGLLIGAAASGVVGVAGVMCIRRYTRLKEDAALGIVLSVFFGAGIALLGVIQKMDTGHAAGLESFIYGKTASMLASDAELIAGCALLVGAVCALLMKEFTLVCFDQSYAAARGFPVGGLDALMLGLVVIVTVVGLQAVGLILMIALLVVPSAAARFWTDDLPTMMVTSAVLGGVSAFFGASLSALVPRLPAGAIIVLVSWGFFLISMVAGPVRGVLPGILRHRRLNRRVSHQHLLRALFEEAERARSRDYDAAHLPGVSHRRLLSLRSWSQPALRMEISRSVREGSVRVGAEGNVHLTEKGLREAKRVVRNHRLWELYLINFADIAPSHVDRDADQIEHVLDESMLARLERLLEEEHAAPLPPPSPHALRAGGGLAR